MSQTCRRVVYSKRKNVLESNPRHVTRPRISPLLLRFYYKRKEFSSKGIELYAVSIMTNECERNKRDPPSRLPIIGRKTFLIGIPKRFIYGFFFFSGKKVLEGNSFLAVTELAILVREI